MYDIIYVYVPWTQHGWLDIGSRPKAMSLLRISALRRTLQWLRGQKGLKEEEAGSGALRSFSTVPRSYRWKPWAIYMGRLTMVIFGSHVKLPEGKTVV